MSTERKMSPSTRFHLLHVTLIVSLHILVVGIAIKWWGIHWLPKYFAFHQNRGYLNSDLAEFVQPWFDFLNLGANLGIVCGIGLVLVDVTAVYFSLRSKRLRWLTDYWSAIIIALPLLFIIVSGAKMLDGYWGLQERIAQQKQRGIGQRARDFRNLLGTWTLVSWEKDGSRQTMVDQGLELTIHTDGYVWRKGDGECLGGWDVYASSNQNELSFVPNEINENAWGGQGYYRVTNTRLALHLMNEPGFVNLSDFDSRTGGELWIFKRK